MSSLTPDVTQSPLRFTQGLNVLDELAGEERVCMFTEAKHCINHTHYKQGLPNHTFSLAKQARTKQDRSKLECETGVRYTELLRLSYYQPIRFVAIDPMHNLFLGTTKHVFKALWTD